MDSSQKEGSNFLNLLQKEGGGWRGTQKGGGVTSENGGSNPGGNYVWVAGTSNELFRRGSETETKL